MAIESKFHRTRKTEMKESECPEESEEGKPPGFEHYSTAVEEGAL